ncbi:MAG: NAD-dependent epimerase/dehydratase family protein [Methanosarcinales archaeon]|nr:MAG: NAD-dependent epimerase/dehydratase family protein [Methanosarcinales archaeon]
MVIRWISEQLGTAPASDQSIPSDLVVLDVRDLVDKFGNSPAATKEKIEKGVALLKQGKRVVVCCDYGISRSNAIAAGILSRFKGIALDQAIREVIHAIGVQEIKLEPLRSVRAALQDGVESIIDDVPRVLLTGGTGFIGQALLHELSRCHHVIAPSRSEVDLTAGALELDLLVKEHRINCIVHLANPRVYTSNHAIGETLVLLRNVLDVCKENDIRLIYPSNWEVYSAYRTGEILADENLPLFPKGPYGETKLLCENLLEHHRKLYGLKCGLLRSSPLYGEASDRPKFIYNFIDKARKNEPIKTHRYLNGVPKLDLLYVGDFVSAIVRAIETNFVGTLNIGAGRAVSTWEVAELIVSRTGSTSTVDCLIIEDYAANITMDIASACKALAWQPTVTWEMGIGRLLESSASP